MFQVSANSAEIVKNESFRLNKVPRATGLDKQNILA